MWDETYKNRWETHRYFRKKVALSRHLNVELLTLIGNTVDTHHGSDEVDNEDVAHSSVGFL